MVSGSLVANLIFSSHTASRGIFSEYAQNPGRTPCQQNHDRKVEIHFLFSAIVVSLNTQRSDQFRVTRGPRCGKGPFPMRVGFA